MTKIKICGLTNKEDAKEAARLGADFAGFIFYKRSPRYIEPKDARAIAGTLPAEVIKVGVFVDERLETISEAARLAGLDMAQLHGEEGPEHCSSVRKRIKVIKAFRTRDAKDLEKINEYDADFYLLDTYREGKPGGTGEAFDWNILSDKRFSRPVILSGGLRPDNVREAIQKVSPYGLDVSSGVEKSPGKKDLVLMRKFIENVRKGKS